MRRFLASLFVLTLFAFASPAQAATACFVTTATGGTSTSNPGRVIVLRSPMFWVVPTDLQSTTTFGTIRPIIPGCKEQMAKASGADPALGITELGGGGTTGTGNGRDTIKIFDTGSDQGQVCHNAFLHKTACTIVGNYVYQQDVFAGDSSVLHGIGQPLNLILVP